VIDSRPNPRPDPLRGEIWEFDLNPKRGHEQRGVRPCLVVSSDPLNRSTFGTVIICPITTRDRPAFRWRPGLIPKDLRVVAKDWKQRPHWVATDQIVSVDTRQRAIRHLATVIDEEKMLDVDDSLRLLLEL
jgi:mRNA-degrading endonuclease toxin of MazEF toxin-antitoxin module